MSSNTTSERQTTDKDTNAVGPEVHKQTRRPAKPIEVICLIAKWTYFTKYGEIFKLRIYSQAEKEATDLHR